jgi:16S rRNA G966 N2-methylase RsmD
VGSPSEAVVLPADALQPRTWREGLPADLLLADPPYRAGLPEAFLAALGGVDALRPDGLVVIEHESGSAPGHPSWAAADRRRYGDTTLSFFRPAAAEKGVPHADGHLPRHV